MRHITATCHFCASIRLYSTGVYCCNSVIAKVCFPLISFPLFPLNNTSSADPLSLSCAQVTLFSQRNILFSIPCSATLFFHQYYTGNSFLDRLQIDLQKHTVDLTLVAFMYLMLYTVSHMLLQVLFRELQGHNILCFFEFIVYKSLQFIFTNTCIRLFGRD